MFIFLQSLQERARKLCSAAMNNLKNLLECLIKNSNLGASLAGRTVVVRPAKLANHSARTIGEI